ncbi:MAG: hypothetical protein Q8T11_07520 [Elusimicrobiota bacterium]|nr:hypothetical protein [Elusimicrobiota bacterium]
MDISGEWTAFAGALFTLMGLSLAAAARKNADDALSWERQWRAAVGAPETVRDEEPRRRGFMLGYRFGGFFIGGIGLGLLYSAATGRAPAAPSSGREALFGGVFFIACGALLAVNAWLRRKRAPRFLDGVLLDADAPPPFGERVAASCTRAMIVLFFLFGLRLLREGLR